MCTLRAVDGGGATPASRAVSRLGTAPSPQPHTPPPHKPGLRATRSERPRVRRVRCTAVPPSPSLGLFSASSRLAFQPPGWRNNTQGQEVRSLLSSPVCAISHPISPPRGLIRVASLRARWLGHPLQPHVARWDGRRVPDTWYGWNRSEHRRVARSRFIHTFRPRSCQRPHPSSPLRSAKEAARA